MKYLLLLLLLFTGSVAGQSDADPLHDLLTKESYYKCTDYAYNSSILIPKYYYAGHLDSITVILGFWEKKCGLNDRILRTKILMAIRNNNFSEDIYDDEVIYHLINNRRIISNKHEYGYSTWGDPENTNETYDKFIFDLATEVASFHKEGSLEYLWSQFYRNEFNYFFEELKKPKYNGTKIRKIYLQTIDSYKHNRGQQNHYAVPFGLWHPTGNLSLLGDHPEIGFVYGKRNNKNQFDMTFAFRFIDSDQQYFVQNNENVIDSTDNFTNLYAGGDFSRYLTNLGPIELWAKVGIAYEMIFTVNDDTKDKESLVALGSLNLNLGLESKVYLNKYQTWYLSFYGRFHAVNFDTRAGTDLSGNVVTYGVQIGHYSLGYGNEILKALNFFD